MGKLIRIPVAPFVGVWIEIPDGISPQFTFIVAPFVGVWIEIPSTSRNASGNYVAPFVGVWIEIAYKQQKNADQESRSLRGSVD